MVSFVRDHVELRVDHSILRALTGPTGCIDGINWRLVDEGSADRLRRHIGLTVAAVQVVDDDHITLAFDSGDRIDVSLRPDDRVGPEAAHFVPAAQNGRPDTAATWIWKPPDLSIPNASRGLEHCRRDSVSVLRGRNDERLDQGPGVVRAGGDRCVRT
jgi:hypothetical protein